MLALVLSKAGITDNLLPVLKQLVLDNPQRVDLRLQLIDVLQQEQRFEEAEHHLQWLVNSETAKKPERFTSHLDVASPEGSPRIELIERESAARQSLPFLDAAYGHLPSLPRPATPVGGQ